MQLADASDPQWNWHPILVLQHPRDLCSQQGVLAATHCPYAEGLAFELRGTPGSHTAPARIPQVWRDLQPILQILLRADQLSGILQGAGQEQWNFQGLPCCKWTWKLWHAPKMHFNPSTFCFELLEANKLRTELHLNFECLLTTHLKLLKKFRHCSNCNTQIISNNLTMLCTHEMETLHGSYSHIELTSKCNFGWDRWDCDRERGTHPCWPNLQLLLIFIRLYHKLT